ncbi:MAG: transposase [Planctomycetota bacterium]
MVRADSGFCREWLLRWCEERGVDYVIGIARNPRLLQLLADSMLLAKNERDRTNRATRLFDDLEYRTLGT